MPTPMQWEQTAPNRWVSAEGYSIELVTSRGRSRCYPETPSGACLPGTRNTESAKRVCEAHRDG